MAEIKHQTTTSSGLLGLLIMLLLHRNHVCSLRSPSFVTGKFKETEVDAAQWKPVHTYSQVTLNPA